MKRTKSASPAEFEDPTIEWDTECGDAWCDLADHHSTVRVSHGE